MVGVHIGPSYLRGELWEDLAWSKSRKQGQSRSIMDSQACLPLDGIGEDGAFPPDIYRGNRRLRPSSVEPFKALPRDVVVKRCKIRRSSVRPV